MKFLGYYLLLINAAALLFMLADKWKAQKGKWRIPERALLGLAIIGGSFGATAGMYLFRHKTKHPKFYITLPILCVLHLGLLTYLVLR